MTAAFLFFGGAADLFLSIMLWFILDDGKQPLFFVDGERVHSVEDVIDITRQSLNAHCKENDQEEVEETDDGRTSLVSRRMIEQFLDEEEGSDREWSYDDYLTYEQEHNRESPSFED